MSIDASFSSISTGGLTPPRSSSPHQQIQGVAQRTEQVFILTSPRSPSPPSILTSGISLAPPWTQEEFKRVEKYSLAALSITVYGLASYTFYAAAQSNGTGQTILCITGSILAVMGTCTAYICRRRTQ